MVVSAFRGLNSRRQEELVTGGSDDIDAVTGKRVAADARCCCGAAGQGDGVPLSRVGVVCCQCRCGWPVWTLDNEINISMEIVVILRRS